MSTHRFSFATGLLLCLLVTGSAAVADTGAQCLLQFDATWSAVTHPINFPASAHFSDLIGGTHDDTTVFWEPGGFATQGIQSVAEFGSTNNLFVEVQAAIATGGAGIVVSGPPVPSSPGSVEVDIDFTLEHPLLTLVTMIAPSPDWFVGVHGLPLFENGSWRELTVVDLLPYDAGTDSGVSFNSANQATVPPEPISRITQSPFPNNVPLGTFSIACTSDLVFHDGFESGDLSGWATVERPSPQS